MTWIQNRQQACCLRGSSFNGKFVLIFSSLKFSLNHDIYFDIMKLLLNFIWQFDVIRILTFFFSIHKCLNSETITTSKYFIHIIFIQVWSVSFLFFSGTIFVKTWITLTKIILTIVVFFIWVLWLNIIIKFCFALFFIYIE